MSDPNWMLTLTNGDRIRLGDATAEQIVDGIIQCSREVRELLDGIEQLVGLVAEIGGSGLTVEQYRAANPPTIY